jgi:VanZ family protein
MQVFLRITMFAWLSFIWLVSSLPAEKLPEMDLLRFDKLSHFVVYFVLSSLVFLNYQTGFFSKVTKPDVLFILFTLCALEEVHQTFIRNRVVSILDLMANLLGIIFGYLLVRFIITNFSKSLFQDHRQP